GNDRHPVAAPKLDWVWVVVDMDIWKGAEHPLHRGRVCFATDDRLRTTCHVRDHFGAVGAIHRLEVQRIEGVVALFHELQDVGSVFGGREESCHVKLLSRAETAQVDEGRDRLDGLLIGETQRASELVEAISGVRSSNMPSADPFRNDGKS